MFYIETNVTFQVLESTGHNSGIDRLFSLCFEALFHTFDLSDRVEHLFQIVQVMMIFCKDCAKGHIFRLLLPKEHDALPTALSLSALQSVISSESGKGKSLYGHPIHTP